MDDHEDLRTALPSRSSPREIAAWALGLSLVPCVLGFLVAPFIAVRALRLLRTEPGKGRALAVSALVMSAVWVVVVVLAIVLPGPGGRTPQAGTPNAPGVAGDNAVVDLHTGDCIRASPSDGSLNYTVQVVACTQAHHAEVYAAFALDSGPYPGADAVTARANEGCAHRFAPYVGAEIEQTGFAVALFVPGRDGWSADRSVRCLVETDGPTTISARDSGPAEADQA
ncbi:MAG: hypothetical protein JWO46_2017 [Nocardioidaceae bacterium]|nr:hypothetical protein [Nocardioidaceae bacterium]